MTVGFQSPQYQYQQPASVQVQLSAQPQYVQSQVVQPQQPNTQNGQNTCACATCTTYTQNPYMCAYTPISPLIVPQGQIVMPSSITQPPNVQPIQNLNGQSVNYNQVTPYLNGNSTVFNPSIQTRSGQTIATASILTGQPSSQEAQIVYQGPVKTVNPQITPVEQSDNEVNKQYEDYFKQKAIYNSELNKAINSKSGKNIGSSIFSKTVKILAAILLIAGIYKYRAKIPVVKRFFH